VAQACDKTTSLTETTAPNAIDGEADLDATFQPITDIPIPPGTTLDAQNSLILGTGDQWTGRLVININQSHSEAFALYTTQMPQFGWKPIASVQSGTSLLTFIRGNRATTIEILDSRAISGVLVRITMTPRLTRAPKKFALALSCDLWSAFTLSVRNCSQFFGNYRT